MGGRKRRSLSTWLTILSMIFMLVSIYLAYSLYTKAGSSATDLMIGLGAFDGIFAIAGVIASLLFVKYRWKKTIVALLFALSALIGAVVAVIGMTMIGG